MSPPISTHDNPPKGFLLLVSVTVGLVWVRNPIRALINRKPDLPPGYLVFLVLLKEEAEKRTRGTDHQRGAGLPGQGGLRLEDRGCVGGNIYLPVALFSRKWPKANKEKTIEHLLPLGMKICVPAMSRGGLAGGKRT